METENLTYLLRSYILVFTCCFLLIIPFRVNSQFEHKQFTPNLMIEGKFHYGFIYAHHLELELFNAHFPAFEISIQKQTYGKHKWERAFAYPIIGLSGLYSNLGNSPYLGKVLAIMPYINFPLVREGKFFLGFRFSLGLGYLTKKFDRITNYKNIAIGSHLNFAINLMFEARYKINTWLTASGGISLQHFSNGALKLPNYGLNAPLVNIGLAFRPFKENIPLVDHHYPPTNPFEVFLQHTIEFNVGGSIGYKDMKATLGKQFMVYHIYENTFYQISRTSKLGLGIDLSYDNSHKKVLEISGTQVTNTLQILRPGINIAYQLVLSKVGFIVNLGYYLGGKEKSNGPLYEKISFQYNFSKNFFANAMLKVHFGRADYIGLGIGYKFDLFFGRKTL